MKWYFDATLPDSQRTMTSGPFDSEELAQAARDTLEAAAVGHTNIGQPFSEADDYLRTRPCVVALVAQGEDGHDVAIYSDGTTRPVGE